MVKRTEKVPASARSVLILRVLESDLEKLQAMREYILKCMGSGVLVLPKTADIEVMDLEQFQTVPQESFQDLPGLAGVEVRQQAKIKAGARSEPTAGTISGRNREEKLAILEQMRVYRRARGLGCWAEVANAAGKTVTDELLRNMLLGRASPPIADWRKIKKTLDKLETVEHADGHS